MENDRKFTLSVAGSRKASVWKSQELMWSEFITRVSVPHKSNETLAEYKDMKKMQQDELKDVGGYMGGILKDGRRRNENLLGRTLITLDADGIPPGGTQDVLKRVSSLGCAYIVHSTRKHEGAAPRLRIIIPTNRMMLPDEYEPIARKMAEMIGMAIFDPTTFEGVRFMYWSSLCKDGEWICQYEDKPFLNADSILSQYTNWRNIQEWSEVSGVQKRIQTGIKKLGNPAEKGGLIGAFCTVYDVPAAIDKFLPDVYEACGNGRYTYRAGSTTGGAVLYDEGRYLFSNHATDPAGGRNSNSFDLVRIHLFGDMDEVAAEGTPINRLPSYKAMCELAVRDEVVKKERIESAFKSEEAERELYPDIIINQRGKVTILPTARNLETLLKNDEIKVSYNMIRRKVAVECKDKEKERKFNNSPNSYGNLLTYCADQFVREGLRVSTAKIHEWVMQIADDNKVNEARMFLETNYMLYGGSKGFKKLLACVKISNNPELSRVLIEKWLCQCVAMAHNENGEWGADGVLVFKGPHGIGKTSFFRKCGSIGLGLFMEGASLDGSKDKHMESTSTWIAELGELPRSLKDLDFIKAFITSPKDKFRAPYAKKDETHPRLTSFCATTNSDNFLKEKGERRFWVVDVEDIDLVGLDNISFEEVWAEAYDRYKVLEQYSFRLTSQEREDLRSANREYLFISDEEALLREKLDWNQPRKEWKEYTASVICDRISLGKHLSAVKIGRALKNIGYDKNSKEYPMRTKKGFALYLTPSKTIQEFEG